MKLIPAIDLLEGRCVRLLKGDFEKVTFYEVKPLDLVKNYESMGFENIHIVPQSPSFKKLYSHFSTQELTAFRYSLYPNLLLDLMQQHIDVEAINSHEDLEAFSLKSHDFFLVTSYYPQVTSTRDLPHPIIYTFLKSIQHYSNSDQVRV